ncbi:MAG: HEAT repeat domain-containing protein, partial [Candidatus Hydrogenedentes bacterium]|nr:HEAT repeat domain-containing protein [Candidatus Hydrogenedentota bacterium]
MPSTLFSETWAELAGSVVVGLLCQGTLIGVVVAVALAATRKCSPNLRYALACVGLLLIAALLPVNFAWLATRDTSVSPPAATQAAADPSPALATPEPAFSPSDQSDRSDLSDSSSPDRPARPSLSATQWYHLCLPWLGRLWAVGIVCFALYDLAGLFALRRLRTKSQAVGENIAALARRVQERLGVHARVQVRWLTGISSALVTGFFRTIILLPASMATRMTPDEIEAILAHEFAHIRRWDLWVNAFQRVVEALLFFHPVVWWLSKTIRAERELCCDELALRAYPDRAQYVRALLTLVETTQQSEALALSSHGGSLVNRVRRILGHRQKGEPSMRRRALGTLVGVVVAMSLLLVAPVLQSVQSASESRDISERQTWKTEQVIEFQVALRETSYKSGDLLDSGKFSTASSHLLSVTPGGPQHVVSSLDGVIVEAKWRNATESRSNVKAPAVHLEGFQWRLRNTLEYGNDTRSYPWSGAEDLYLERDWHILKTPVSVSSTYEGAPTLVLRCRWTEVTSQPGKLDLQAVGSLAQDRDEALAQIRAAEANLRNAQWGEPVSGLQAGLIYEDAPRSFRVGETVGFVLMLRNISDQPIALDYVEPGQNAWVPEVRDSARTAVPVLPPVLSTVRRVPQVSLAPGEARILDRGLLTMQSLGWRGPVNGVVAFCESGRYSVRYTFPFGPDSNGHSRLHPWEGDVTTGQLEMEIVSPQVGSRPENDGRAYSNGDIRTVLHILSEFERLTHIPSDGGMHDWEMLRANWAARCAALSVGAVTYLEHVATEWLDEGYRAAACDALGDTQQPSVCEVLVECLADPSANVRRTAARSLGELGSESNVPRLAQLLLSDPDAIVRMSAAYALGHIASNQATQTLVSALQHDDYDSVKQAAALALGWITDASALPALKEALPQTDNLLRDYIEAAIRNIEDPDFWGLGVKKGIPENESAGRNEESTRALFEAFLMSERSLTMLPGNMDLGWEDIPALLKLAEDTPLIDTKNRTFGRMLLTEIPAKPYTGDPQSWAVRGMISLWVIEGIRCGYGVSFRPPLYGFCFKDDLTQAQCEASDTIHKETLAAYQKWWDAVKELPIEEAAVIDPLLGTDLRWCVPQQPRPPTAASSQPEPRSDATVPASPITGLPEPPFTIEEVAAYHREKTGT